MVELGEECACIFKETAALKTSVEERERWITWGENVRDWRQAAQEGEASRYMTWSAAEHKRSYRQRSASG